MKKDVNIQSNLKKRVVCNKIGRWKSRGSVLRRESKMASLVREWQSYRKGNKGDTSGNETPE